MAHQTILINKTVCTHNMEIQQSLIFLSATVFAHTFPGTSYWHVPNNTITYQLTYVSADHAITGTQTGEC